MSKALHVLRILNETIPSLEVQGVTNNILYVKIGDKLYGYKASEDNVNSLEKIANSVKGIAKYSQGKAIAYLKKNTILVSGAPSSSHDLKSVTPVKGTNPYFG